MPERWGVGWKSSFQRVRYSWRKEYKEAGSPSVVHLLTVINIFSSILLLTVVRGVLVNSEGKMGHLNLKDSLDLVV